MKNRKTRAWMASLAVVSALLAVAIAAQVYVASHRSSRDLESPGLNGFNPNIPGWHRSELPIADTEYMRQKTEAILQYDDYRYYSFSQGGDNISLYVAWWEAGKISPKEISWHNPDVCWVGNGFERLEAFEGVSRKVADLYLLPGQERSYSAQGRVLNVVFWHLVAGRPRHVELSGRDPWYAFLIDMKNYGINIRQPQMFVRISSNLPVDELARLPAFGHLVAQMPWLRASSVSD